MSRSRGMAWAARLVLVAILLASCAPPTDEPSPSASASASATPDDPAADAARLVARKFVAGWLGRRYERMTELLAPADRDRYTPEAIIALLRQFDELAGVTRILGEAGPAIRSSTPGEGSADGPVPAFQVPISLAFETTRFGRVAVRRMLLLTEGSGGWEARWRPSLLFPGLDDSDALALQRTPARRGRIVSVDGSVFAETRDDGVRVYPQEWLAGQTIGYVAPVTAEELTGLLPSDD